jgi:hypothetical protein
VKSEVPIPVGFPEIIPVLAFSERPAGSDPELILQI